MSDQTENIFGEPIEPAVDETPEAEPNPLHEQFLSSLPEDVDRDMAAQLVPHWDKFVQDQFTERDSQLKQFEPYQALIEAGVSPEEAQWYLENREALHQDPQQQEQYQQQPEIDEFGDPVLTGLQQQVAQQNEVLMALLQEREQQQQFEQQMMQEQAFEQSKNEIKDELRLLKDQYPELTEDEADDICQLASRYADPDEEGNILDAKTVLERGFADFQRIASHAERALFEKKTSQPAPAERGGRADTSAEPIVSFDQAGEMARMRVREMMGQ